MTTWAIPSSHGAGFVASQAATALALRAGKNIDEGPAAVEVDDPRHQPGRMIHRGGQERRLIEPEMRPSVVAIWRFALTSNSGSSASVASHSATSCPANSLDPSRPIAATSYGATS